jgi:DeoR family suf operon transcriptional repressor
MTNVTETSDDQLLGLLRQGPMSVAELARAISVTATAVRQRLSRLTGQGMIQREVARAARGRPSHRYSLTDKARRQAGNNFADLAMVLWDEIRSVKDAEVRRGLLARLAKSLASMYGGKLAGTNDEQRMESLKTLFSERRMPLEVEHSSLGTRLTVVDCPYPELAEKDRGVCAMERMLFTALVDSPLRLSNCRLDGHSCCQFETIGSLDITQQAEAAAALPG